MRPTQLWRLPYMGQKKTGLALYVAALIAAVIGLTLGAVNVRAGDRGRKGAIADGLPPVAASSAKPWSGLRLYGDLGYAVQTQRAVDNDDGGLQISGTTFDVSTAADGLSYGFGTGYDVQF